MKIHLRALAAADPVALLGLHPVDKVHMVKAVQQLLRIGGDFQHPLIFNLADDLGAAALTFAVNDLLVGQTALAGRTPVDGHLALVGQSVFVQLKKNPLRPAVIIRVGGIDLPRIVERETEFFQLLPEMVNVRFGDLGGMNMILNGIVLRRQAEGIPADGIQDVIALHAALSGDDVQRRVGARMPDMQTRTGGVREFNQAVVFRLGMILLGSKGMLLLPNFLPFGFDFRGNIRRDIHGKASFNSILDSIRQNSGVVKIKPKDYQG